MPPEVSERLGAGKRWSSLRPEALRLVAPEGARLAGKVTGLRYPGAGTRVAIDIGGTEIAALVPSGADIPGVGSAAGLAFDAGALHLMEEA